MCNLIIVAAIRSTGKRFWNSFFYVWFTQRSSSKNSIWQCAKKPWSSPWRWRDGDYIKWWQTTRHNSNADICNMTVDCEFCNTGETTAEFFVGQQRQQISWIEEEEMVASLEELKSSRSVSGKNFQNFWDAGREDCLGSEQDHPKFPVQKRRSDQKEQKAQKEDRFLRGRQIALMIYDFFRVTGAHDTVLDYADSFSVTLRDDNIQELDTRCDEVLLSMSKIPSDDVLESLYKLRIRELAQLKNVLELYDMEIHQKDIGSQLSKIENNGEKKYRSETPISKLWRQAWETWIWIRGKESKGNDWRWRRKRYLLPMERKRPVFAKETDAVSVTQPKIVPQKNRPQCRHTFWAINDTRSKCVEEEKYPRQKSPLCHSSTTVQILFERYLHANVFWVLASTRMSILLNT